MNDQFVFSAQLVIVYGRRRVGKTYLIKEFFDYSFAFKLTGAFNQSRAAQLENFALEIKRKTKKNVMKFNVNFS